MSLPPMIQALVVNGESLCHKGLIEEIGIFGSNFSTIEFAAPQYTCSTSYGAGLNAIKHRIFQSPVKQTYSTKPAAKALETHPPPNATEVLSLIHI